jgi:hypothetical protein
MVVRILDVPMKLDGEHMLLSASHGCIAAVWHSAAAAAFGRFASLWRLANGRVLRFLCSFVSRALVSSCPSVYCPLCWLPWRLVYVRHVRPLDSNKVCGDSEGSVCAQTASHQILQHLTAFANAHYLGMSACGMHFRPAPPPTHTHTHTPTHPHTHTPTHPHTHTSPPNLMM